MPTVAKRTLTDIYNKEFRYLLESLNESFSAERR